MHPSLLLSSFSALPGYRKVRSLSRLACCVWLMCIQLLKIIAVAAAKGSLKHLATLCQVILNPDLPQEQIVLLLAALYPNLDPAAIPKLDALDNALSAGIRLPRVEGAMMALNALSSISRLGFFPVDAAPDLWPRAWKWIDFLHTYWDYLPGLPHEEIDDMCQNDAYIVMTLANHKPTARLIYATHGVRFLLVSAWKTLLDKRSPVPEVAEAAFQDAGRILNILTFDSNNARNNEEILDAAGGNIDDLSILIVAHLARGTVLPKSDITVACQGSAITFCKERGHDHGSFPASLLSHGIVAGLVEAILAFDGVSIFLPDGADMMGPTIRYAFDELLKYMVTPPGYPWVTEALKAGLLHAIISFGSRATPNRADPCSLYIHLRDLLHAIIPGALVYCGVVTQVKESFKQITITSAFKRSSLFQVWETFTALVERRVGIFDTWTVSRRLSLRACDNMKVCLIGPFSLPVKYVTSAARLTEGMNSNDAATATPSNIARGSVRPLTGRMDIASSAWNWLSFDGVISFCLVPLHIRG